MIPRSVSSARSRLKMNFTSDSWNRSPEQCALWTNIMYHKLFFPSVFLEGYASGEKKKKLMMEGISDVSWAKNVTKMKKKPTLQVFVHFHHTSSTFCRDRGGERSIFEPLFARCCCFWPPSHLFVPTTDYGRTVSFFSSTS